MKTHFILVVVLLVALASSQGQHNLDPQRRCNARFGDYSDFAQSRDFPYSVTKKQRRTLLRSCGQLTVGMSTDELLRQMGTPDYIEPEDLNDARKGGCRWTWVVTDPSPKGDHPDSKYRQVDVLVGTHGTIVEVNPKHVRCTKRGAT